MLVCDVSVVGGGPAGAAAAITLARAGRDVVLVDKAAFPRDKCCGDGLTTGALRRLESLGLRPEAVASWPEVEGGWARALRAEAVASGQEADVVWFPSPPGPEARFPLPRQAGQYAVVARRVDLDA